MHCMHARMHARVCRSVCGCGAQGLADGLKLLMEAYKIDPGHVGVLAQLSHYCLVRIPFRARTHARAFLEPHAAACCGAAPAGCGMHATLAMPSMAPFTRVATSVHTCIHAC